MEEIRKQELKDMVEQLDKCLDKKTRFTLLAKIFVKMTDLIKEDRANIDDIIDIVGLMLKPTFEANPAELVAFANIKSILAKSPVLPVVTPTVIRDGIDRDGVYARELARRPIDSFVDIFYTPPKDAEYKVLPQGKQRAVQPLNTMLDEYGFRLSGWDNHMKALERVMKSPILEFMTMEKYREIEHRRRHGTLLPPVGYTFWKKEELFSGVDFFDYGDLQGQMKHMFVPPIINILSIKQKADGLVRGEVLIIPLPKSEKKSGGLLPELYELVAKDKAGVVLHVALENVEDPLKKFPKEKLNPLVDEHMHPKDAENLNNTKKDK